MGAREQRPPPAAVPHQRPAHDHRVRHETIALPLRIDFLKDLVVLVSLFRLQQPKLADTVHPPQIIIRPLLTHACRYRARCFTDEAESKRFSDQVRVCAWVLSLRVCACLLLQLSLCVCV